MIDEKINKGKWLYRHHEKILENRTKFAFYDVEEALMNVRDCLGVYHTKENTVIDRITDLIIGIILLILSIIFFTVSILNNLQDVYSLIGLLILLIGGSIFFMMSVQVFLGIIKQMLISEKKILESLRNLVIDGEIYIGKVTKISSKQKAIYEIEYSFLNQYKKEKIMTYRTKMLFNEVSKIQVNENVFVLTKDKLAVLL